MNKMDQMQNSLLLVSGGVDSMSLLHFFINKKINCSVLHVNHLTRGLENEKELEMIRQICNQNNIVLHDVEYHHQTGNFQAKAREYRYQTAKKLVDKYNYSQIITAHHRDDLVENILMYSEKINDRAIKEFSSFGTIKIYRPLLKYYKEDIYEYARQNNVIYNEDISNQKLTYRRNKYRHLIVANLTTEEKETIILNENERIKKMPKNVDELSVNYLNEQQFEQSLYIIDKWLRKNGVISVKQNILKQIYNAMNNNGTKEFQLEKNIKLIINYGVFKLINGQKSEVEEYKKLKKGINYFNGIRFYCPSDNMYATVRKPGDKIVINGMNKRVSRLMIEYKIDRNNRDFWPIICTKERKLVYLPKKIKK